MKKKSIMEFAGKLDKKEGERMLNEIRDYRRKSISRRIPELKLEN